MTLLRLAVLSAFALAANPAFPVNYEINKNTTVLDDQGGSISTRSTGSLSSSMSLISAVTSFDGFLFQENPRIALTGELSSTLSGGGREYVYDLGGELDVEIGDAEHRVNFDSLRVRRNGLSFVIEGHLLVDGQEYVVPPGDIAEDVISAIIVLQGQ